MVLTRMQELDAYVSVCSNLSWYYSDILEVLINFYISSIWINDQSTQKIRQITIHRCQPIHVSSLTNPTFRKIFIYEHSLTLRASCWKKALCNNRSGFTCSAGVKNSGKAVRYKTETSTSNAGILVTARSLFQSPVKCSLRGEISSSVRNLHVA
jgi:hypothetical protein